MTAPDQLNIWAAAYVQTSRQLADLTEQRDQIKAQIAAILGDTEAEQTTRDGYHVTYKTVTATRLDTKRVRGILEQAGALDACTVTTQTRRLTVTASDA